MTRVVFLWTKTVLDWRSGGAISTRAMLEVLADSGFDCHAISMTVFDGREEFPLSRLLGPELADDRHCGGFIETEIRAVRHQLFRTGSTLGRNVRQSEAESFLAGAIERLRALSPDILLCTGGGPLTRELHRCAAAIAPCRVFYLANAAFSRAEILEPFQHIWCPSRALARLYRDRLGMEADVFPNVMLAHSFVQAPDTERAGAIRRRYVTFINPTPEKGAMLFFRLARLAAMERPDIRFLVIAGRASRTQWQFDPDQLPNVQWIPNRRDMRPVYRRTAMLLFPTLCFEAAGRVAAEAQLSGIPVLATRRGGIPEQLNGAGFLFDPPQRLLDDFLAMPTDEDVRPWLDRIITLHDDPAAWRDASEAARAAAEPFHPRTRNPEVVRVFRDLASASAAG
ncbi:MAG: glycosyltransferase family 4 protein [Halofilum sp. (in: g-proteobacteria)]|nr:glycosyltransferase family 4 protein [Halofilum sp. (in: g-proteobacteria)]